MLLFSSMRRGPQSALSPRFSRLQQRLTRFVLAGLAVLTLSMSSTAASDAPSKATLSTQPDLAITIDDGGTSTNPTATLSYTVDGDNNGTAGATGVDLTVTVPANSVFDTAGSSGAWSCADGAAAGTMCTQSVGALGIGGNVVATFAVRVANTVPADVEQLSITGTISDDGLNGVDPNLADNTEGETTPLLAAPVLVVNSDDRGESVMAADVLVYDLTYGNNGNQATHGVVLTQTVPDQTEFDAPSSPGWSCAGGGGAGDQCTLSVGDLGATIFNQVPFGVRVNVDLPLATTQLSDTFDATDDGSQTGGTPVTGQDIETTPVNTFDRVSERIYAFEDLKNDTTFANDFDYNDWIISVELREEDDGSGNWSRIDVVVEALARGAGFNHQPRLDLGISGMVSMAINRFDRDGTFLSRELSSVDGDLISNISLFGDTFLAMPSANVGASPFASNTDIAQTEPNRIDGLRVHIRATINETAMNPRVPDDPQTMHLDETFNHLVGPFINVIDTGETIFQRWRLRSATQDVVTAELYGEDTPLLGLPLDLVEQFDMAWQWPIERAPIWEGYPDFVSYIASGKLQSANWFQNPALSLVWPVMGSVAPPRPPELRGSPTLPAGSFAFNHAFSASVSASPAVGDLDNNGTLEVVGGGFLDEIVIFDAAGDVLQTIDPNIFATQESNASISLADLDGDLDLEIIRGFDDGAVYAFHHDGSPAGLWVTNRAPLRSTVTVIDVLGDTKPELFLLAGDTMLYGWDTAGALLPGFPVAVGGTVDQGNAFVLLPAPVVADVDGVAGLEIVTVSNAGDVHVLDTTGAALTGWPVALGETVLASPAVADLDAQAGLEIVVADDGGDVTMLAADGSILRTMVRVLGGPSSPAIGDLDNDADLEIVVGSLDGRVYAWHHDGTTVSGWPFVTGSAVQGSPAVTDLDGDGSAEVVFGSFDMSIYALDGGANAIQTSAGSNFPVSLRALIFSSPAIADLDGDGLPSILVGANDRRMYALEANGSVPANAILWSEFRNGEGHTGLERAPAPPDNGLAPIVVSVRAGSAAIGTCGEAQSAVSQIDIGFSELLTDHPGATTAGDVSNPDSYRLLRAGSDRDLQTIRCRERRGDDELLTIDAVSWNPATRSASLIVGGDRPLPDDLYRLLVCDSLTDLLGNGFDGDGDGDAGGDWLGQVRIANDNALRNGQLDCDLAGWFSDAGPHAVHHTRLDVDDAGASGALQIVDLGMPNETVAFQCLPLTVQQPIFSGVMRVEGAEPASIVRRCTVFTTSDCRGGTATLITEERNVLAPDGTHWTRFRDRAPRPLVGVSYQCEVGVEEGTGPSVDVLFDDLTIDDAVLFSSGFESGDISQWSSTIGVQP